MLKSIIVWAAALGLAAAPAVAQTTASQGRSLVGKTHVERAIGKCGASLLIGSLVGAAVGAAAGNTKRGALIGLGAGAAVCVYIMIAANKQDKALIRAAQLEALNTGSLQTVSRTNEEGQLVQTVLEPSAPGSVLLTGAGSLQCRQDDMCRVGDSWLPRTEIMAGQAPAGASKLIKASFTSPQQLVCRKTHVTMTVDQNPATDGSDTACLIGDTWVTGDQLKKRKINESHVTA